MIYGCNVKDVSDTIKQCEAIESSKWSIKEYLKNPELNIQGVRPQSRRRKERIYTFPPSVAYTSTKYTYVTDVGTQLKAPNVRVYQVEGGQKPEFVVLKILQLQQPGESLTSGGKEHKIISDILYSDDLVARRNIYPGFWPNYLNKIYHEESINLEDKHYVYVLISYEGKDAGEFLKTQDGVNRYKFYEKMRDITFSMHEDLNLVYSDMKIPNVRVRITDDGPEPVFVDLGGICVTPQNEEESTLCSTSFSTNSNIFHCSADVKSCLEIGLLFTAACIVSPAAEKFILKNVTHNNVRSTGMSEVWDHRYQYLKDKRYIERHYSNEKKESKHERHVWFERYCFDYFLRDMLQHIMQILLTELEVEEGEVVDDSKYFKMNCLKMRIIVDSYIIMEEKQIVLESNNKYFNKRIDVGVKREKEASDAIASKSSTVLEKFMSLLDNKQINIYNLDYS